jgi:hypothetical protein
MCLMIRGGFSSARTPLRKYRACQQPKIQETLDFLGSSATGELLFKRAVESRTGRYQNASCSFRFCEVFTADM